MVDSEKVTSTRSAMYRLLEQPFRFPDPEITQTFRNGKWLENVRVGAESNGFSLPCESNLVLSASAKDYEVEFISLFEVGMGGAPCPLHSGHYGTDRMITMEEVLRFYRFFDYRPDRSADRFPDHINFELQFIALLADLEAKAEIEGGDVLSPVLAQRDFASRNLAAWLPKLVDLIERQASHEFFTHTSRILRDFVLQDCAMLKARAGALEPA